METTEERERKGKGSLLSKEERKKVHPAKIGYAGKDAIEKANVSRKWSVTRWDYIVSQYAKDTRSVCRCR